MAIRNITTVAVHLQSVRLPKNVKRRRVDHAVSAVILLFRYFKPITDKVVQPHIQDINQVFLIPVAWEAAAQPGATQRP